MRTQRRTAGAGPWLLPLAGAALLLGACAGPAPRAGDGQPPASAARPGGYYLDDGPGDHPPANLDAVPDARPRAEPVRAANSRPYQVMGRTYVPMSSVQPFTEEGVASWYGRRYHGQPTASGEIYDMYAMTAAHPTLPIPSYARVSRVGDDRAVVVRVNDRGPFHADRIIDLSYTAAYRLGIVGVGSARVRVETVIPADAGTDEAERAPPAAVRAAGGPDLAAPPAAAGVYLQLGAFALPENAESFLRRMRAQLPVLDGLASVVPADGLYRVHAGPYPTRAEALQVAGQIERVLDLKPIVLTR